MLKESLGKGSLFLSNVVGCGNERLFFFFPRVE